MLRIVVPLLLMLSGLGGCGAGEFALYIDNETGATVTVTAPRGNGKSESVTIAPLGAGRLYVSKQPDSLVTTAVNGKPVEEFEVSKVPEMQTGVHDVTLYLIQPGSLNYDLYTADYSGLYGEHGTTGLSESGKLADVVNRTGTKFVKLSAPLGSVEVSLPSQVVPREMAEGRRLYRLVRVAKGLPADKVEPYMLALLKTNQGRQ